MKEPIIDSQKHMRESLKYPIDNFDYYEGQGYFIDNYTIEIKGERILGKKIFIGSGARPIIPEFKGVDDIEYLTNENVFDLKKCPKSIIIIGGGYIGVEFAHFFSAMGSEVTILQHGDRLIKNSEPEISHLLKTQMEKRMKVLTNIEIIEIKKENKNIRVIYNQGDNSKKILKAEKIFISTGRKSNADLLKIENTKINVDKNNYIQVNEYLETSQPGIWALGDANGRYLFKHVANYESLIVYFNAVLKKQVKVDYHAIPHAVFTDPEIAGVGMREKEAVDRLGKNNVLIGYQRYQDTAKGEAMSLTDYFVKVIVERNTLRILGAHIIGPHASVLIQEIINLMYTPDQSATPIINGMHIHPALNEVVERAFNSLMPVDHYHHVQSH